MCVRGSMATAGGSLPESISSTNGVTRSDSPKTKTSRTPASRAACSAFQGTRRYGDDRPRSRVSELLRELGLGVGRIDCRDDTAKQRYGMKCDRILGQVRAVDREDVAFAETPGREARRRSADAVGPAGIGQGASGGPVDKSGLLASPGRAFEEQRRQRDVGDFSIRFGGAENHNFQSSVVSRRSQSLV